MRFLTAAECDGRAQQAGIKRPGGRKPARHLLRLVYQSRMTNADAVASALVACLGPYDWAIVWAYDLPWGDRSRDADPPPDWRDYAAWRLRRGERRSLCDVPGHEFDANDDKEVGTVIRAAICMGWDAWVFSSPLGCMIDLSHDDIITVLSRNEITEPAGRLFELGFRRVFRTG